MAQYGIHKITQQGFPNIFKELKKQKRFSQSDEMFLVDRMKKSGYPESLGTFPTEKDAEDLIDKHARIKLKSKKISIERF